MNRPVGLQLYSVRHQAAADLHDTIRRVSAMGYNGVEFAGFHGHSAESLRKTLDECNLKCCGTHTAISHLDADHFDQTVADHKALGTHFVIIPWLPEEMRNTPAACEDTAKHLTELAEKLSHHSLRLGFHAHQADMLPLDGGLSAWYILAKSTPHNFIMQYDTANGMSGGADPVAPIIDQPGRSTSLHLKEWNGGHGAIIGEGEVPWKRVIEAAETTGGTEWYVVEYEVDADPDPMDSVYKCLAYLQTL